MSERAATLTVRRLPLGEIKQHPRNPRKHPEPGTSQWLILQKSLEADYFDPMVVNDRNGMLVSGHFRHKVLLHLGFTHADVSVVDYDEPTHLARLIAANSLLGEWEADILDSLAVDIDAAGLDSALAGWSLQQMSERLGPPAVTDDTETAVELMSQAEKLQEEWRVAPGDLYQIGPHRLICGSCTVTKNWTSLLDGRQADMVWTDPPYNVAYDGNQRKRIKQDAEKSGGAIAPPSTLLNDDLSPEDYEALLSAAFQKAFAFTKAGGAIYVAHAESCGLVNRQAFAAAGWYLAQCIVWVKNAFTMGRQDYQWQHEPILYGWKPKAGHYWQGGFCQASVIDDEERNLAKLPKPALVEIIQRLRNARETTVVREPRNAANALHPTVKPLGLVARQLWSSSRPGETVADCFGGSGTTLVAADQIGRAGVACELEPKFSAVILQRLKEAGHKPEKIGHA